MTHALLSYIQTFAVSCPSAGDFFGLPAWYKYLPGTCTAESGLVLPPGYNILEALPLVLLAIVEIALRIAGIVAVFFVVYGGVSYTISQGEPDKVSKARGTIINALVGLVIATFATAIVAFIGNRVG